MYQIRHLLATRGSYLTSVSVCPCPDAELQCNVRARTTSGKAKWRQSRIVSGLRTTRGGSLFGLLLAPCIRTLAHIRRVCHVRRQESLDTISGLRETCARSSFRHRCSQSDFHMLSQTRAEPGQLFSSHLWCGSSDRVPVKARHWKLHESGVSPNRIRDQPSTSYSKSPHISHHNNHVVSLPTSKRQERIVSSFFTTQL